MIGIVVEYLSVYLTQFVNKVQVEFFDGFSAKDAQGVFKAEEMSIKSCFVKQEIEPPCAQEVVSWKVYLNTGRSYMEYGRW